MKGKLATTVLILFAATLLLLQFALADPTAPTTVNEGTGTQRNLSLISQTAVSATGGYVTPVNVSAMANTKSWQGYYGDVTGNIILADGQNKTFYNWSIATPKGEILATRASSITWSNIACASADNVSAETTYLGQAVTDSDSVNNTYSLANNHPAFDIAGTSFAAGDCPATNAWGDGTQETDAFYQVLLHDGGANIVYTTLINASNIGFDAGTWDFELLVGENQHTGNPGSTNYYFWVELE